MLGVRRWWMSGDSLCGGLRWPLQCSPVAVVALAGLFRWLAPIRLTCRIGL